jgi:hypothetical protein
VLVQNGLFSLSQLQQLGGVAPTVALAPSNQQNFSWLRSFDLNLAWKYKFKERVAIEPSVSVFNLFNFANFNLPGTSTLMTGLLTGSTGSINNTGPGDKEAFRAGNGTGTYALGVARQIEWGLKLTF